MTFDEYQAEISMDTCDFLNYLSHAHKELKLTDNIKDINKSFPTS